MATKSFLTARIQNSRRDPEIHSKAFGHGALIGGFCGEASPAQGPPPSWTFEGSAVFRGIRTLLGFLWIHNGVITALTGLWLRLLYERGYETGCYEGYYKLHPA